MSRVGANTEIPGAGDDDFGRGAPNRGPGGQQVMPSQNPHRRNVRLPPEVNRILYVRNLPYKMSSEEFYDVFGRFGSIRQIRKGSTPETKGTAFVVYDDVYDAKMAMDSLSGFNVDGRYLVLLYYNDRSRQRGEEMQLRREELEHKKRLFGVKTGDDGKQKFAANS